MAVSHDLNAGFALLERYFENLVGEIAIPVEFVERFGEQFSLKCKVHAHRTIEEDKPGAERYIRILAFAARRLARSTKIFAIHRYQDPILVQQDSLQLPVLPTGLADPHDVRGLVVASLAGHQSKF